MTENSKRAEEQKLNSPLAVVDTGLDEYESRIEDSAGINIAMCFAHEDAAAIVSACNDAADMLLALKTIAAGYSASLVQPDEIARRVIAALSKESP